MSRSRARDRGRGRSAGDPWSPADLASFVAWYDDTGLPGADVAVSSWAATSGVSAPTFTQGTSANQPNDRGTIYEAGRRRGAYCDGGDCLDAASRGPFDYLHDISGSTLVAVVVPRGTTTDQVIVGSRSISSHALGRGAALAFNGNTNAFTYYVSRGAPGSGSLVAAPSATGTGTGVNVVSCRVKPATTRVGIRVNGGTEATSVWNTPDSRGTTSSYVPRIGSDPNGAAGALYPWKGELMALLVFSAELSDTDLALVEAYLAARYSAPALTSDTTALTPALTGTLDVMCVGDSITYGSNAATSGFAAVAETTGAGAWNMIGPVASIGGVDTNGRSGWLIRKYAGTSDGHSAEGGNLNAIDTVLATYDPDVIVMLLGVNSLRATDPWGRNHLRDLYELLIDCNARRPSARYVVCTLLRRTGAGQESEWIQLFNSGLANVVSSLRGQGLKIIARDWYNVVADADMSTPPGDGLHPNDTGHGKLGADLHTALGLVKG